MFVKAASINYLRFIFGQKHTSPNGFPRNDRGMPYNLGYCVLVIAFKLENLGNSLGTTLFFSSQLFVQQTFNKRILNFFYLPNNVLGAGNSSGNKQGVCA